MLPRVQPIVPIVAERPNDPYGPRVRWLKVKNPVIHAGRKQARIVGRPTFSPTSRTMSRRSRRPQVGAIGSRVKLAKLLTHVRKQRKVIETWAEGNVDV